MSLRDLAARLANRIRRKLDLQTPLTMLEGFGLDPIERERLGRDAGTDFAKLFYAHHGRLIHKWVHYLDIYDRYFGPYRNTPVKFLEIGVSEGGSLELWRKFFGEDATIFGIDIHPKCAERVTPPNQVRIGSQDDPAFLRAVVKEMGALDVILDDGSHISRHLQTSFDVLFPLLREGGLYVMVDLHTSYFAGSFEGGYRRRGAPIERVKDKIDDMHAWYHRKKTTTPGKDQIGALHVYDSLVFFEKRKRSQPAHIRLR
jgi:hypothetical protein